MLSVQPLYVYAILHYGKDVDNKPMDLSAEGWYLLAASSHEPREDEINALKSKYGLLDLGKLPRRFPKTICNMAVYLTKFRPPRQSMWVDAGPKGTWKYAWYIAGVVLFDTPVRDIKCHQGRMASWALQDEYGMDTSDLLKQISSGRAVYIADVNE